jgi:hypothetical protein
MMILDKSFIEANVPSKARMMAWINEIYNQGIQRPGYPADDWVEKWIKNQFEQLGLLAVDRFIVKDGLL